jgi:hypothetical protein
MKFSMTGQEKGDLLIQVTAWAGLTVYIYTFLYILKIAELDCCQIINIILNIYVPSTCTHT